MEPSSPRPALVVMSGRPGTGKTTISRRIASELSAAYLRIDTIEVAIEAAGLQPVGAAGYFVAQALAASNLAIGVSVVADCVNPVHESRAGWRNVAVDAVAMLVDIQLICSDRAEHRRRVETRTADIAGHRLCVFRRKAAGDSDPFQPVIPTEASH